MIPTWGCTLPPDLARELLNHLHAAGCELDIDDAVCTALRFWLDAMQADALAHDADGDPNPSGPRRPGTDKPVHGYQWKCLFLPEGSRLRLNYRPEYGQAVVVGDRLMLHGMETSPNRFACSASDGMRNAWRDLGVLLAGERHWQRASALRREREAQVPPERYERRTRRLPLGDLSPD